ncbi:hypothetical protein J4Q44_G00158840 [Coregonus suidteri]|uniref:Uncharacterized protein n=1 Tax=Coregonus suidteri TaxID=861788 RepID=A0AAN8LXR7_9TELE
MGRSLPQRSDSASHKVLQRWRPASQEAVQTQPNDRRRKGGRATDSFTGNFNGVPGDELGAGSIHRDL